MELEVHDLAKEEVYRGWVRIPEAYRQDSSGRTIREASIIRITYKGKSALVVARGDVTSSQPTIRIEALYKDFLGLSKGAKVQLVLQKAWIFGKWKYYWTHLDPITAFTMKVAIISLFLGMVGLVLGAVPLFHPH